MLVDFIKMIVPGQNVFFIFCHKVFSIKIKRLRPVCAL